MALKPKAKPTRATIEAHHVLSEVSSILSAEDLYTKTDSEKKKKNCYRMKNAMA